MKRIAVLFFVITLAVAFVVSSGAGYINEVKVIHPERHVRAGATAHAADSAYIIGVSYEDGTLRIFKAQTRPGAAAFGLSAQTEYRD